MNIQTHIYKFICILLCTHVYIHNHTYTHQVGIQHVLLVMWAFLFWFYRTQEKFSSSKAIFILNTQCCNTKLPIQMTATKYKKLQAIGLFVEISYNNRKSHQTFS